jgi:hypothetical protein
MLINFAIVILVICILTLLAFATFIGSGALDILELD